MKTVLVQCRPKAGDLAYNMKRHEYWIRQAHAQGAGMVIFPELSLTGYEPQLAARLAVKPEAPFWKSWQALSNALQISFGLGMPIRINAGIVIGLVLFQPNHLHWIYAKQYLHADEKPFFVPGTGWDGYWSKHQLAFAICYELSVAAHADCAIHYQAQYYVASVAKFAQGIAPAYERLAGLARTHQITTMMVNAVGAADGGCCTGQSAIWDKTGQLIVQLGTTEEGMISFDLENTHNRT